MKSYERWAVGMLVAACGSASADVVVVGASRDNTIYQGAVGDVSNGAGPAFFAGETNSGVFRRALLRFDLSAIPPGSTVTSVVLTLHLSKTLTGDYPVALHRALQDWGEGTSNPGERGGRGAPATPDDATWDYRFFNTLTWSAPGGVAGTDYAETQSATATIGSAIQNYTWGSTPEVVADAQAWVDSPASNFGWFVIGNETDFASTKRFDSRENIDPAARPSLSVTYTPPAPPCYPNCDGSSVPPVLNANDFQCFLNSFAGAASYANCDGSSVEPVLNANDFQCFLNAFAGGCT